MSRRVPPIITPIAIVSIGLALGATTTIVNSSPTYGLKKDKVTTTTTTTVETTHQSEINSSSIDENPVVNTKESTFNNQDSMENNQESVEATIDSKIEKEQTVPSETSSSLSVEGQNPPNNEGDFNNENPKKTENE